jgi:salicylate hydroxylase
MSSATHVVIVGAGVGGLTAALALLDIGARVTVLEQAPELTDVGAGIQLAPNATRVLRRLGALEPLLAVAHVPPHGSFRRWDDGRLLSTQRLGPAVEAEFGAPYLQLHRGDVVIGIASVLPPGVLRLGCQVTGVEHNGDGVRVYLDGGEVVHADVLVAADGVKSAIRHQLFGADDVTFAGVVAYRGLVPAEQVADIGLEPYTVWLGPGRHFVQYYVRGRSLVNFVGLVDSSWKEQSWTREAPPDQAIAEYAAWDERIPRLLKAAPSALLWALAVRDPLPTWNVGRIALLGDSAHAMVPFLAQGAAQAILDAGVLARCLEGVEDDGIEDALARYAEIRHVASAAVAQGSTETGKLYNAPDGPVQQARDQRFAADQEAHPFGPQAAYWGFDPYTTPLPAVREPADGR